MVDFETLAMQFVEGTLDTEEAEELLRLLDADPTKRRQLAEHVVLGTAMRTPMNNDLWAPYHACGMSEKECDACGVSWQEHEQTIDFDVLFQSAVQLPPLSATPKRCHTKTESIQNSVKRLSIPFLNLLHSVAKPGLDGCG